MELTKLRSLASKTLSSLSTRHFATRMQSTQRRGFDELTAGADPEQLEFMKEQIIQVDEQDNVIGPISKKDAHLHDGVLHRAFSVFLFNSNNELLIQKRAEAKITFPGVWANSCCSHPMFSKEEMEVEESNGAKRAAIRKLNHELGVPADALDIHDFTYAATVMYKAASDANWTEYEMDHVLLVKKDVSLDVNPGEVAKTEYVSRDEFESLLHDENRNWSPWFRIIAGELLPHWWGNLDSLIKAPDAAPKIHDRR